MEQQHTQEPWSYEVSDEYDKNSCDVFDENDISIIDGSNGLITEANASRIVACVNACAGISTEDIQLLGSTWIVTIDNIKQQRDELLESLETMLEYTADLDPLQGFEERDSAAVKQASATIASVKGGAA